MPHCIIFNHFQHFIICIFGAHLLFLFLGFGPFRHLACRHGITVTIFAVGAVSSSATSSAAVTPGDLLTPTMAFDLAPSQGDGDSKPSTSNVSDAGS